MTLITGLVVLAQVLVAARVGSVGIIAVTVVVRINDSFINDPKSHCLYTSAFFGNAAPYRGPRKDMQDPEKSGNYGIV
ncbi:hypothetical protein GMORB2_4366 [Geosmithia morbida]|uniref:Uncharacterized protein n=1 Tax=Geosmithia morbida TaxID=1094350 RepID=A0A9P4YYP8_9HYPO|nr:uncharacterized protein GMORB2_4366 [Geosmithia morbida]KAF4125526.1 hypothetical protein GMORB2_4366 [Geosmithia morbida]